MSSECGHSYRTVGTPKVDCAQHILVQIVEEMLREVLPDRYKGSVPFHSGSLLFVAYPPTPIGNHLTAIINQLALARPIFGRPR